MKLTHDKTHAFIYHGELIYLFMIKPPNRVTEEILEKH